MNGRGGAFSRWRARRASAAPGMPPQEALYEAVRAVRLHPLRSLLAALGIVIAVASVLATRNAADGLSRKVEDEMAALGTNLVFVFNGSSKSRGVSRGLGTARTLTYADGLAIQRELSPWVAQAAPVLQRGASLVAGGRNWSSTVLGTTAAYLDIRPARLRAGRFLSDADDAQAAKHCVLGHTVAAKLFGQQHPLGQRVRVQRLTCQVVGVMAPRGQSGMGQDMDDLIYLPHNTLLRRLLGRTQATGLYWLVSAKRPELTQGMQVQIAALLRQRHRLAAAQPNDFSTFNLQQVQETARKQMRTLSLAMGAISAISLLVGTIGVANVLLVSVTERTREIGLRMALGARRRDILAQFLAEAVVMSLLGGGVGVGVGLLLSEAIARYGQWQNVFSLGAVVLALLAAASTGVLAGLYPALRASRLRPITALRAE